MKKLDIIYEDKELLVVNKPTKKLTIATEKNKYNTLYHEAREYVKKQNPKNKIFIVHRLDEQTSGIVLFAKNEKLKYLLQKNWQKYDREYIALVEGKLIGKGTVKSYLKESKTLQVYSTNDSKLGKLAITNYESIQSNKNYSLVKINIETGRKNQIRVHLSDLGHPIVGDKKYNAKTNILNRLGLHANKLEIIHPLTKKKLIFEAKLPKVMTNLKG
ncbi:MAG: RluA family pseudouridine synthase [Bacilli bacterium]|nr:RluA family pseudouridine synthase [Bacilli bacterium]